MERYARFKAVIFQPEVLAAQRASRSTWRYFHLGIITGICHLEMSDFKCPKTVQKKTCMKKNGLSFE